jgi:hypothetical protein
MSSSLTENAFLAFALLQKTLSGLPAISPTRGEKTRVIRLPKAPSCKTFDRPSSINLYLTRSRGENGAPRVASFHFTNLEDDGDGKAARPAGLPPCGGDGRQAREGHYTCDRMRGMT